MKTALIVAAGVIATATVDAGSGPLTPEQALDRRSIGELTFTRDGAQLAFVVTEPPRGSTPARRLWLLNLAGKELRQLTMTQGKSDSAPQWSPDGRSIAFLSNRDSDRESALQLYLLPMRGGEAERLVDRKEGVTAFRWSPDGTQIAFLMPEARPAALERKERDRDDARVVEKDDRPARLWVLDVRSRTIRQVTAGIWRIGHSEWLPSGDRLIASATDRADGDRWTQRLYAISLSDGQFTQISAPRGPVGTFDVSPDGRTIAYLGARVDGPQPHDLWLQPVAGGAPRNLTGATLDRPVSQPHWVDARTLVAHVVKGFASALVTIGTDGQTHELDGLQLPPGAFARAANGIVAYVAETAVQAPEVWVKTPGAAAERMTAFNQEGSSVPLIAQELTRYRSFDGTEIEAALLVPPGAAGRRVPLVVLVHGGPTGRWSDVFEPWGQLLACRGYAVLYPNVRGSTGYGQRFVELNRADWGGGDFKDVMAGVDWAVARGIADPDRLAIGGWSYGGYMAAWAVTQTSRFKAAVVGAPVIDLASEYGTEAGPAYDEWFYGLPYEKLDGFIRSSPITYVKNVKTPTLLLQGEQDVTDPIGQSQQFYRGLKRYGIESDLVLYPREGHGLREEKHLVDRLTRIIAWYDKYLSAAGISTTERDQR
jgi:dipeptidyl aminopeptidase/acylaminoacyl peptidase